MMTTMDMLALPGTAAGTANLRKMRRESQRKLQESARQLQEANIAMSLAASRER